MKSRLSRGLALLALPACGPTPTDPEDSAPPADTAPQDTGGPPQGDRVVSGNACFFDASAVGAIEQKLDVEGTEIWPLEYPSLKQVVGPDGAFRFEGIPSQSEITLALSHPWYFPTLTGTLPVGDQDLAGVTFQAVTVLVAAWMGMTLDQDPSDPTRCQMATTVAAMSDAQDLWWAPGEPDATVTLDPPVPADQGPYYFNTSVIPDPTLAATTSDGGVIVVGATPGTYTWTAWKEGLSFNSRKLTCLGGWLTNASPPFGLQASLPPPPPAP